MKLAAFLSVAVIVLIGVGLWLWTPDKSRAVLEAKYLDKSGDLVDVSGVRLHVRDRGPKEAPALIMIHGFGSSLHTWELWSRSLQDDYRVIRFDLPGSGLSAPDPAGDYSDARSMVVLSALMDRLNVAQATLIGNSIGGRIAWKFAALHPERVTKLVLISPDGFASPAVTNERSDTAATVKLMRYVLPKSLLRLNLEAAYGDPSALTKETLDRYYDLILAPGVRDAMIARMDQTQHEDPRPLLQRIRVPVLLIWARRTH